MTQPADFASIGAVLNRHVTEEDRQAQREAQWERERAETAAREAAWHTAQARLGAARRAWRVALDSRQDELAQAKAELHAARGQLAQGNLAEARKAAGEIPALEALVERAEDALAAHKRVQP